MFWRCTDLLSRAHFMGALMLLALVTTQAFAADTMQASAEDGYGRMVISLDPAGHVQASLEGAVLRIAFDRRVSLDPSAIAAQIPAYVTGGRIDNTGKTMSFALTQSFRLHTSVSGSKTAIDLVPESFAGNPPDLPRLAAAAPKPVDPASLPAVRVRAGIYQKYSRIVFDWPQKTAYTIFSSKGHLTVRFKGLAQPDFSAVDRISPPWVRPAGWHVDAQNTIVEFQTDTGSKYKDFADGNRIVVDVLSPDNDSAVIAPKAAGASPAQAQAIADAAARLNANPDNAQPAAASAQSGQPSSGNPATPDANAPAAAEAAQAGPQSEAAMAERTAKGAVLVIPHASGHAVAAFLRGMTAWMVIDTAIPIDPAKLKTELGDLPDSVDVASGNDATIIRIGLKQAEQIAVTEDGVSLKFQLAPGDTNNPLGIGFARDMSDNGNAALVTLLPSANRVLTLSDPNVGDTIVAVLGRAGRAVLAGRDYADFSLLPTAAGIAVKPLSDGVTVTAHDARVRIAKPGGLSLTPPAATSDSPALLTDANDNASFLDFAHWPKAEGEKFLEMERKLRKNVANAPAVKVNNERLKLAQFYLANGFAAETLGVLRQMHESDPALDGNRHLQVMRAAADYMMGRFRDTHNDLIGASFVGDRHAAFWRGLADAATEDWTDARQSLLDAGPVIKRYPAEWRARAQLAITNAALAAGSVENADLALAKVPKSLPKALMLERELAHARLLAAEDRYKTARPIFAALKQSGDDRIAANAIYEDTKAAIDAGALARARGIEILEELRFRWRGDALEMKALRKLGALYFANGQWREGLEKLRVASLYFPNDDLARQAQDDMRNAFEQLFLKGKADSIPPIEALSLFYDFIDLTPIGPNGDEMIRRMAERLTKVDLLGPAAALLSYQVNKRLDGVARAQVAARLAMLYLMDHKPEKALQTLRDTALSGLPDDVNHQRMMLEARALAAMKRYDQALDLVAVDNSEDARRLQADIAWDSGQWSMAAQNTENLLGQRWSDGKPLDPNERNDVMRAAIAYSLANDEPGLERLRAHFAAKMQNTPDANAFAVVTQDIDRQGLAFRETAAKVASVGTLEAFMKDFSSKYSY
ncbi:MAG TPA: hypothetical protein VG891_06865 [Rhizomicrobium sp.]|nr:hypothetical protein [Rhizomicrobium sp.]